MILFIMLINDSYTDRDQNNLVYTYKYIINNITDDWTRLININVIHTLIFSNIMQYNAIRIIIYKKFIDKKNNLTVKQWESR